MFHFRATGPVHYTLMKLNSLIPNTVKPTYNGTAAAGGFRFKQVFELLILATVTIFL